MARSRGAAKRKPMQPSELVGALTASEGIDVETFLEKIIEEWGGITLFASAIKVEFDKAPAGSVARQRLLAMIHDALKFYTSQSQERKANLEDVPTEDLERVARDLLAKIGAKKVLS